MPSFNFISVKFWPGAVCQSKLHDPVFTALDEVIPNIKRENTVNFIGAYLPISPAFRLFE